jgi:hypothetical protein
MIILFLHPTSFCATESQQAGPRAPLLSPPHRNEPKSARKPLRRPQIPRTATASPEPEPEGPEPGPDRDPSGSKDKDSRSLVKAFSTLSSLTTLTDSDSEKKTTVAGDADDDRPVARALPAHIAVSILGTPKTPLKAKPKSTPARTARTSKKALALAEQAERATYAQSLFDELNRGVFAGGLPAETTLVWSNRLLTTAGRARWHRCVRFILSYSLFLFRCFSFNTFFVICCQDRRKACTRPRSSSQRRFWTPKASESLSLPGRATRAGPSFYIFTERIRNTLSHEMCHLACWIINQDPKEGHGKVWKSWWVTGNLARR